MRHFYLTLSFIVCVFIRLSAQVTVTPTIGATTSYTTLKAAFDAINAGTHQGSIVITITASTTETATAALTKSGTGSSSYTAITIYPTTTATISGNIINPLIQLNGAQNITIDGRINQAGSTRSLTLQNTSNTTSTSISTLRFSNDASNNNVQYTNLEGSARSNSTGTVSFVSTSGTTGVQNITISNNDIRAAGSNTPYVGIYSAGFSGSAVNKNITVSSNLIHDYFISSSNWYGIRINTNNSTWTISGNSLYQTATRTTITTNNHYGIYIASGDGYTISGNYIGGSAANAGGSAMTIAGNFNNTFIGIYLSLVFTNASNIDGNVITNLTHNFQAAASAAPFYGIYVNAGKINIGVNSGNTIGAASGNGAITLTTTNTTNTFCTGIFTFTNTQTDIRNNSIGAISASSSSAGAVIIRGVEADYNALLNIQNNTVGGPAAASIQVNSPNHSIQGFIFFSSISSTNYTITGNTINNIRGSGSTTNSNINAIFHVMGAINLIVSDNISNNTITNLSTTSATGNSFIAGIDLRNNGFAGCSIDAVINNNQVNNLTAAATGTNSGISALNIGSPSLNSLSITNNTISGISSAANYNGSVAIGIDIYLPAAGLLTVTGNTIYSLSNSGSTAATMATGISTRYSGSNAVISKNKIYDISNPNTPGGSVNGMILNGSLSTGTYTVSNNMISLSPANTPAYGLVLDSVATLLNAYYNTAYLSGTATGTGNSGAFTRNGATNNTPVNLKNNIFYNTSTGGSGNHYSILNNSSTPLTGWTSDYNDLYTTNSSTVALWNATALDLATYITTSAQESHSVSAAVNFVNAANGDLHITGTSIGNNQLAGIPVSVTDDYDSYARSTVTTYMGADEATQRLPVSLVYFKGTRQGSTHVLSWKAECTTDNNSFIMERRSGTSPFDEIGTVISTQLQCNQPFSFTDNTPLSGLNYYRLKMKDASGAVTYSHIITLLNKATGFELVSLQPSVVTDGTAFLNFTAAKNTGLLVVISDIQGRMLQKNSYTVNEGTGLIQMNLGHLAAGQYLLTGSSPGGYKKTFHFIKR